MLRILSPVSALLVGVAVLFLGHGVQVILLPVRASIEQFSAIEIGLLGSAYFAGFVLGCLRISYLVRNVGHIRTFAALVAMTSAVPLIHVLAINPVLWWILRAITGFCLAGIYLVIESWLNERSTNETRGTVFSVYTSLNLTALTVGQLVITIYDPATAKLFLIASVIVSLSAIPVALTRAAAPTPLTTIRFRPLRLVRISPVGVAGCVAVGVISSIFWSMGPAFALDIGLGMTQVAVFMAITVIGGAVGQWPFGLASDRTDRRRIIVLCSLLGAAAGVGLFLVTEYWFRGILILAFLFGAATMPLYSLSVSHVNDHIDPEDFVETTSGLLLAHGIAAIFGPVLGSAVMQLAGASSLFLVTAAVNLAMAGFAYHRMRRHPRAAEEQQAGFVYAPPTTPALTEMDPRAEEEDVSAAPPS